jgi:two-component system, NtrC family, sensor histidine kinase HydH
MLRSRSFQWSHLYSPKSILLIWGPIVLVTALHYTTGAAHHWAHDIFRRLYYIPIVLGAFGFGVRGSLAAAIAASLLYSPHAFTHFMHHDPGSGTEKILEILLYNVIALVAGLLADREYRERKKQQATAEQLRQALDERNEMERLLIRAGRLQAMGELTAGLAHEIKNPLASIQGTAEIVIEDVAADSPKRGMADILMKELKRLEDLLERFLSFARPEQYDLGPVDLGEQVEAVVKLVEPQAGKNDVRIEWKSAAIPIVVQGEKDRIQQVLMNLILNAAQAMPNGGTVKVATGTAVRGKKNYAAVAVEDDGPGVPVENREKIFNPFFTTKEKGTGLGLAVATRIVDQHGGFLDLAERTEGGTKFELLLPLGK